MGRTVEVSGHALLYLFYASSLAALLSIIPFVLFPLDDLGSIALAVLLVSLVLAGIVGLWRRRTGREGSHLGTAEDIAYDPIADPGQAAKHSWTRAVRRLPGGDDEEE